MEGFFLATEKGKRDHQVDRIMVGRSQRPPPDSAVGHVIDPLLP